MFWSVWESAIALVPLSRIYLCLRHFLHLIAETLFVVVFNNKWQWKDKSECSQKCKKKICRFGVAPDVKFIPPQKIWWHSASHPYPQKAPVIDWHVCQYLINIVALKNNNYILHIPLQTSHVSLLRSLCCVCFSLQIGRHYWSASVYMSVQEAVIYVNRHVREAKHRGCVKFFFFLFKQFTYSMWLHTHL